MSSMSYLADQHSSRHGFGEQSNHRDHQDSRLSHRVGGARHSGKLILWCFVN